MVYTSDISVRHMVSRYIRSVSPGAWKFVRWPEATLYVIYLYKYKPNSQHSTTAAIKYIEYLYYHRLPAAL